MIETIKKIPAQPIKNGTKELSIREDTVKVIEGGSAAATEIDALRRPPPRSNSAS